MFAGNLTSLSVCVCGGGGGSRVTEPDVCGRSNLEVDRTWTYVTVPGRARQEPDILDRNQTYLTGVGHIGQNPDILDRMRTCWRVPSTYDTDRRRFRRGHPSCPAARRPAANRQRVLNVPWWNGSADERVYRVDLDRYGQRRHTGRGDNYQPVVIITTRRLGTDLKANQVPRVPDHWDITRR